MVDTKLILERFDQSHGTRFDYSSVEYVNANTEVSVGCRIHGKFPVKPELHRINKNGGCPGCTSEARSTSSSQRPAIETFKLLHPKLTFGPYTGIHDPLPFICNVHGNQIRHKASAFYDSGCPLCAAVDQGNRVRMARAKTEQQRHAGIIDRSVRDGFEYLGYHNLKLHVRCKTHDESFWITSQNHTTQIHGGCPKCYTKHISAPETEVYNYIKTLSQTAVQSDRTVLKPKELDIYDPESKIAIEFDGLYWHSSGSKENDAESRKKHVHKTDECNKLGIQLFHVFENEWNEKPEIWKSVIQNAYGQSSKVYARQCEIGAVDSKTARAFCDANHLQGGSNSSIAYGLYHNTVLVSLMTFGPARYSDAKYELLRFCNKLGLTVVGGASKLIKHFRKHHSGSIVSYANKRWSIGNLYDALGFEYLHDSDPCYWYFKTDDSTMFHRSSFMKHKLKDKLETFDPDMSEVDNMYANGYRRIWDSGNKVYILR